MNALVTGASGFVGQHLVRFLWDQGIKAFTLGKKPVSGAGHFDLECTDNIEQFCSIYREISPDYVFHLAGTCNTKSIKEFYNINVVYSATLLEALIREGSPNTRVLIVGSAAEYGLVDSHNFPVQETHFPRPNNHYGISKLSQTLYCSAFADLHKIPMVIVRPFTILGPGMPPHLAVGSFVKQINDIKEKNGIGYVRTGSLNTCRDFISVNDFIKICWCLINKKDAFGKIVNVCSGKAVSIKNILEFAIHQSGLKIEIRKQKDLFRKIDFPIYFGDNSRMLSLLGGFSFTPWKESILEMLKIGEK